VAVAALVSSGLLWQKLSAIQEQLARQSADSGALAIEARTMARQAEDWCATRPHAFRWPRPA